MDFLDCGRLSAVWNGCLDRIVVSVNRAAHARCISCGKAETKWVRILDFAVNEIGCSVFKARYPPLPLGDDWAFFGGWHDDQSASPSRSGMAHYRSGSSAAVQDAGLMVTAPPQALRLREVAELDRKGSTQGVVASGAEGVDRGRAGQSHRGFRRMRLLCIVRHLPGAVGAELNAELELQTAEYTTRGKTRPRGKRGAFVADHVAEGPRGNRRPVSRSQWTRPRPRER